VQGKPDNTGIPLVHGSKVFVQMLLNGYMGSEGMFFILNNPFLMYRWMLFIRDKMP
jgi:hypothetical protein